MNEAVFGSVAAITTVVQAALGLAFVLLVLPALDRLESPYMAIPKFWLMAVLSTTGSLLCAGVLWALAGEAAKPLAEGAGLMYLAQLPFGVAGTLAFVLRQARATQIKKVVRDISRDA